MPRVSEWRRKLHSRRAVSTSLCIIILSVAGIYAVAQDNQLQYSPARVSTDGIGVYIGVDSSIQLQRFVLPARTKIDTVWLGLHGDTALLSGHLVILGHEGGDVVPTTKSEILAEYDFGKSEPGYQRVAVPVQYLHPGGQLFIGVRNLASGVTLTTDRKVRDTVCWWRDIPWNDQVRIDTNGTRKVLPFAFDVSVFASTSIANLGGFVRDTLVDALADRLNTDGESLSSSAEYSNTVCEDVTGDGVVEVICGGVVQLYSQGTWRSIEFIREETPTHTACADLDGDGVKDVICVSASGAGSHCLVLSFAGASSGQGRIILDQDIELPRPNAHVILDANVDGLEDVVFAVGHGLTILQGSRSKPSFRAFGVALAGSSISMSDAPYRETNQLPRFVLRSENGDVLEGTLVNDSCTLVRLGTAGTRIKEYASLAVHADGERIIAPSVNNRDASPSFDIVASPRFERALSAIQYVDLDANGVDEVIASCGGQCQYISVWKHNGMTYSDITFDIGLSGIDDCKDFLVTDISGDDVPDLILTRRHRLEVYMNRMTQHGPRLVLRFDIPGGSTGTSVTLYDDGDKKTTRTGACHGYGLQQPTTISIATDADGPDSISVVWPNNRFPSETFTGISNNAIVSPGGGQRLAHDGTVPFTIDAVHSDYVELSLQNTQDLTIDITTIDGRTLYSSNHPATSSGSTRIDIPQGAAGATASGALFVVVRSASFTQRRPYIIIK